MSASFTPGPWHVVDARCQGRLCIQSDDATIAYAAVGEGEDEDAHLIAAAPTLYGQIESAQTDLDLLRRAIEENDPKAELLIRVTDLWKRNQAALAKATPLANAGVVL